MLGNQMAKVRTINSKRKKTQYSQLKAVPARPSPKKEKKEKYGEYSGSFLANHKSQFIIGLMAIVLAIGLAAAYSYLITNYTVTTIYVEGNVHYTNEEVIAMVMEGYYGNNSLLLSLKYKDRSVEGVPFVEKMDVTVLDPHTIKIEVYEKALAGYVEYLEKCMYFDKDGIVVESSDKVTAGVPMITGFQFDHVILHEPLPVEDEGIFKSVLNITQLVNKYDLTVDKIYFGSDDTLTLYFGGVRASLGSFVDLDEKIMRLQDMLPSLTDKKGTLHMENYTEDTKNISFEPEGGTLEEIQG